MKRSRWRLPCASALLGFACCTGFGTSAFAQEPGLAFDIPSEPLSQALSDYARAAGRQIIFTQEIVGGRLAPAVQGSYTADAALARLLDGTGLVVRTAPGGALMVVRRDDGGTQQSAPGGAHAQVAGAASGQEASPTSSTQNTGLTEVVITAERRPGTLDTLPVSGVALTGKQLTERGVTEFTDLQFQTPSLTVQNNIGTAFAFTIRGVGQAQNLPGVSSFVDGAYIAGNGIALGNPFFDVDHVEVLRGPQGTFGVQAIAGAVLLVTNDPDPTRFGIDAAQTVGNYSDVKTEGAINLPLSNQYAVRLALDVENRDSYFNNIGTVAASNAPRGTLDIGHPGNEPGNLNTDAFRFKFLGEPTDNLKFELSYERFMSRTDGFAGIPNPNSPAYAAYPYKSEPYTTDFNTPTGYNVTVGRAIGTVEWNLPDIMTARSVTSSQTLSNMGITDTDGYSTPTAAESAFVENIPNTVWTEELDLLSNSPGPLQWTAGVFFDHQQNGNWLEFYINNAFNLVINHPQNYSQSEAAFGQVTYDLLPELQLTAGFRENRDHENNNDQIQLSNIGTGKLALDWKVTGRDHVYLTASKGSSPGNYNSGDDAALEAAGLLEYRPATVYNYELGWKTAQLDNHFHADIDAFYMNYQNFQVSVYVPAAEIGNTIINLPKSTIEGIESQFDFVEAGFTANLMTSYVDSKIATREYLIDSRTIGTTQFPNGLEENVDGDALPNAPRWTISAGAQYRFLLPGGSTLTPRLQWSYLAKQLASIYNPAIDPYAVADEIGSHDTLDARLTYEPNRHWSVAAYGSNLTDQAYVTGIAGDTELYGAPRQYGVRLEYSN